MISFRVRRMGKLWEAYLKRPASDRPLFYTAPTKYEAIGLLLNGVARMAREQPGRLWPQSPAAAQSNSAQQLAALRGN